MATPRGDPEAERQLGRIEGRIAEQSASLQQMRADLTAGLAAVNTRIDRLLLANIALGGGLLGGLIGLIATLIVRGG